MTNSPPECTQKSFAKLDKNGSCYNDSERLLGEGMMGIKMLFPYSICDEYYYCFNMRSKTVYHSHPLAEIYYFHSGTGEYILGDTVFQLKQGDLIIMDGLTRHGPKFNAQGAPFVRTMFQFEPYALRLAEQHVFGIDLLQPFEQLGNYIIHLHGDSKEEFEQMLSRFNRFYGKQDPVNCGRFLMAFYDMLLFIYEKCKHKLTGLYASGARSEKERIVRQVIQFIEHRYMDDLTLDELVKQFHLSKQYLSKLFREVTGMTIMDYIYRRRINQAKILFYMAKEQAVTDVCFQVGFKDVSHFSRKFKLQEGLPPEQYRRTVQGYS